MSVISSPCRLEIWFDRARDAESPKSEENEKQFRGWLGQIWIHLSMVFIAGTTKYYWGELQTPPGWLENWWIRHWWYDSHLPVLKKNRDLFIFHIKFFWIKVLFCLRPHGVKSWITEWDTGRVDHLGFFDWYCGKYYTWLSNQIDPLAGTGTVLEWRNDANIETARAYMQYCNGPAMCTFRRESEQLYLTLVFSLRQRHLWVYG